MDAEGEPEAGPAELPLCPEGAQLAAHETFDEAGVDWPAAWRTSGGGDAWIDERGGAMSAAAGATSRLTLYAPLALRELRLRLSFSPAAPQSLVLGMLGAPAASAPPFAQDGIEVRVSRRRDSTPPLRWAVNGNDEVVSLDPPGGGLGADEAPMWLRVRVRPDDEDTTTVGLQAWPVGARAPEKWTEAELGAADTLGTFSIAAITHADAGATAAVHVQELVLCVALRFPPEQ
jgi:hypothetical protein